MKKLKVLDLNYNIDLSAFNFYVDSKELFVSLEVLKLSNTGYVVNSGYDILERVNSLKYLDLSGNERFTWADRPFTFLIGKENMTYLNFSGVDMNRTGCLGSSLPKDNNTLEPLLKLKTLDLSHCNLQGLNISTFLNFPALEYLDLSFNPIKSIPNNLTSVLPYLKVLSLSHYRLGVIHLDLSSNITGTLKILDLMHNDILISDTAFDSGRYI
ncbi:hypothetical protein C0J52_02074 [Blattella germanica]|nr:hypothetical protein C0J52_02074 [Blattella germanica]